MKGQPGPPLCRPDSLSCHREARMKWSWMCVGAVWLGSLGVKAQVPQQWPAQDAPGSQQNYAFATAVDGAGHVFVTGRSDGLGTGPDYATVAYDGSGTQLWVARYNGPGNGFDIATAIAVDDAGRVYVTGWSNGGATDV